MIAIFCTRLLNNLPPVLYEDGEQTRDFSFVEDIARANLLAAESDQLDGLPVNVGSGRGVSIRDVAEHIAEALGIQIAPEAKGEFRPGEMRHLTSGTDRIRAAGYKPDVGLAAGIGRYSIGFVSRRTFATILAKRRMFFEQQRHRSSRKSR